MRKVGIVGAGITPCKSHWMEQTYYGLSQMAVKTCLEDAAMSIRDVDAVVYGIYNDIFELSAIPEHPLHGIIGMTNKPGVRVTNGLPRFAFCSGVNESGSIADGPMDGGR